MECANPSYLKNGNIYHWSNPFDSKGNLIFPAQKIDCRHCVHCRKNRGKENAVCSVLESDLYVHNHFITLTKNPEYEKDHPVYEKKEIKGVIRRLRRYIQRHHNITPRVFRVHEHGRYGRSHYHLIVFNCPLDLTSSPVPNSYNSPLLEKIWPHGHHTVQDVNYATAMYQSQYLDKDLINGNANNSRKAISYHCGIGTPAFLKHYKQWFRNGYITTPDSKKAKIPRKFTRIAQKHVDSVTLTNEQYCFKYSKKHCQKVIANNLFGKGPPVRLCTINIEPNLDLVLEYQHYKNKLRDEEKNDERMKQITDYVYGQREKKPDFHESGKNTVHDQLTKRRNVTAESF